MTYYETPLAVVAKGAIAGLAGTAAITMAMRRTPQLLQQLGLQPSELGKVTTILALAAYLSRGNANLHRMSDIFMTFLIVLVPVILIVKQPDMGTTIVVVVTAVSLYSFRRRDVTA